jgi:hypothetical protein
MHPKLVVTGFSLFDCQTYLGEPRSRLMGSLDVYCFTGQHLTMLMALGLPYFIIVVLGMPLMAYVTLRWNKSKMYSAKKEDAISVAKLSFLYKGYKKQYYYWEIAVFFRKLGLGLIGVFMSRSTPYIQGLTAIFILGASFVLPYAEEVDSEAAAAVVALGAAGRSPITASPMPMSPVVPPPKITWHATDMQGRRKSNIW